MQETDRKFCVYAHRLKENNSIFYIGQGTERRASLLRKAGRSDAYQEVIENNECYYQIIENNLTKEEAEDAEQEIMNLIASMGVKLTNKLFNTSKSKTIRREDYPMLEYAETTSGNLVWAEDRYAGAKTHPYLKAKKGSKAATQNMTTGYFVFRNTMAHRIVYALVHGMCPANRQVNHIDGDKGNNKIANLELVTASQNIRHAYSTGLNLPRIGEENPTAIITENTVLQIYDELREGLSNEDVAAIHGIEWKHVSLLRNGSRWKHLFKEHGYDIPKSSKQMKVTDEQITKCIMLIDSGMLNIDISNILNIEVSTVSRIRHKKIFKSKLDRLAPNYITT